MEGEGGEEVDAGVMLLHFENPPHSPPTPFSLYYHYIQALCPSTSEVLIRAMGL